MILTIILSDQFTKGAVQSKMSLGESIPVIDGFFSITYVQNFGAAFGFLATAPDIIRKPLFLFVPVAACFWLIWLIWDSRKKSVLLGVSYSLILAGAVGNLFDRFTLNYVVDFFDFYYKTHHYPAFNIADSAISIAAVLLVYDYFRTVKNSKREAKTTEAS